MVVRMTTARASALLLVPLLALLLPATALAGEPWDTPFHEDAAAVLKAAQAVDVGDRAGGLILLAEGIYSYDDAGLMTRTTRVVVRILDRDGVEQFGSLSPSWSPWYEGTPEIRGRIIGPDGGITELDASTMMERRVGGEADMYWDRRVLEGPLPPIDVVSVVETEVTVAQHRSFFDAGTVNRTWLVGASVTETRRVVLEHPKALKMKVVEEEVKAKKQTVDGRIRRTWELSPAPTADDWDPWLPPEEGQYAMVGWSTGKSWKDVATAYHEAVEAKLAGADLETLAKEVAGEHAGDRDAAAEAILRYVTTEVRYTGLELGESALIPATPAETMERGYGDCKDQSTLMAGMLRALGYEAHLALLLVQGRRDVSAELPGLGDFDHAIVVVRGPGEPLWIDPTNRFHRAGRVSPSVEDRRALIADPATRGLTAIGASAAADNGWEEVRVLTISDEANAHLRETTTYRGAPEASIRDAYTGTADKERREYLGDYVVSQYDGGELTELTLSDPEDLSGPFVIDLEADDVPAAWAADDEAWARLPWGGLLREIDGFFFPGGAEPEDEPRTSDVYRYAPFSSALVYEVHAPPGYELVEQPDDEAVAGGPFAYARKTTVGEDGAVRVRFEVTVDARRFDVDALKAMRDAIGELDRPDDPYLHFVHRSRQLVDEGKTDEAIAAARADQGVGGWLADVRVAELLLDAGAGEAARVAARRATEANPESGRGWRALAWALQHDELGRRFSPGWDRAGAIAAYEQALALDETDWLALADLSVVHEYNELGQRYGDEEQIRASIARLEQLREHWDVDDWENNLLANLFRVREFDELRKLNGEIGTGDNDGLVVAAAALDSLEQAVAVAKKKSAGEQQMRELLADAYGQLYAIGEFEAAAEILQDLSVRTGSESRDVVRMLRDAHELSEPGKPKTATEALHRWLFRVMEPDLTLDRYREVLTEEAAASMTEERLRDTRRRLVAGIVPMADEYAMSPSAAIRIILAAVTTREEAVDKKIVAVRLSQGFVQDEPETFVFVKEGGDWKLAGAHGMWHPVGDLALGLVAKKPDVARRLVQLAASDLSARSGFEPYVFRNTMKVKGDEGTELAAHVLACFEPRPACLEGAERAASENEGADKVEPMVFGWLGEKLYRAQDTEGLVRISEHRFGLLDDEPYAGLALYRALLAAGRADDAATHRSAALEASSNREISELLFQLEDEQRAGDLAAAMTTMEAIEAADEDQDYDNNLAWYALFVEGSDLEQALERAKAATGDGTHQSLHTLATVHVERAEPALAYEALIRSMDTEPRDRPSVHDWYVIGRIAELYGEPEAARAAYERVEPTRGLGTHADDTRNLAQRRLDALGD